MREKKNNREMKQRKNEWQTFESNEIYSKKKKKIKNRHKKRFFDLRFE